MKKPRIVAQSREAMDARLGALPGAAALQPPARGWVKAIREALGMSSAQFARRMGIRQPSVVAMEQSEAKGAIQLATLRRAAAALDCTLVYALVPNDPRGSLEAIVQEQARRAVRRQLRSVEHSMALEAQRVPAQEFERRIDALARDVSPRALWDGP